MKHLLPFSTFLNEDFIPYDYSNTLEDDEYPANPFPNTEVVAVVRRGSHYKEVPTEYPMFFTEDIYVAESYGHYVREAHINITNMLDLQSAGEGRHGEGLTRRLMPYVYTPAEIDFIEKSDLLNIRLNLDAMCYKLHNLDFEDYYQQQRKGATGGRQGLRSQVATEYFAKVLNADNPEEWAYSYTDGQFFMLRNALGHPLTTVLNFEGGTHVMEKVFEQAKQEGYDGIMMNDESSDVQQKCISYVVFKPEQISWIRQYKHDAY